MLKRSDMSMHDEMPEIAQTLHFEEDALPQIREWGVNEDYQLLLRVRLVSKTERSEEDENEMSATFKVVGVENVATNNDSTFDDKAVKAAKKALSGKKLKY